MEKIIWTDPERNESVSESQRGEESVTKDKKGMPIGFVTSFVGPT